MRTPSRMLATWCLALSFAPATAIAADGASTETGQSPSHDVAALEFFEKKVRPLLVDNCYTCHSANTNSRGGLRVDDRNGLLQGGGRGAAIVPGKPDESLLIRAVRHAEADLQMPPKKQLSAEQVADLSRWIADGAVWPSVALPDDLGTSAAEYDELRRTHWAWQPLNRAAAPAVKQKDWPRDDLDRFILARLEVEKLSPVGDADRLKLIRRIKFDLTGLPPSPAEIDAFLWDSSPDAATRLVDQLLASTAFGERWGRHWLDVARYAESTGSSRNLPYPHAWRYRDYVIDAVNKDKPYDQFIREQIAGDLLPADSPEQREEQITATGFLALGVKDVNQRFKVRFIMDNIDEQIDAVSRAVLATTASCARCHDHKFDPIPTSDYYALAGIFASTDLCAGLRNKMGGGGLDYYDPQLLWTLNGDAKPDPAAAEKIAEVRQRLAKARKEFQALKGNPAGNLIGLDGRPIRAAARQKMNRLQAELFAVSDPAALGATVIHGVREGRQIGDTEVRVRGEAEQLGPKVARGFPSFLAVPDAPAINPTQSGRLELAAWLTSAQNPLTPRVMVNRVWRHLFGAGLVTSVDNFGVTGDTPSHPELLDHLAARFVQEDWSVKKLVRTIVLSRTYQLDSTSTPERLTADPANRLIWRHTPRRLEAEEIRDAILVAADALETARPEASPAKELKVIELRNNGPEARQLLDKAHGSRVRSVYLPLVRGVIPRSLEVFDFAEQGMVTGSRDTTTVAPQALYLLNDPFVRKQALALAQRLVDQSSVDDEARIDQAYRLILGRAARAADKARVRQYLDEYVAASQAIVAVAISTETDAPLANEVAAAGAALATNATDAEAAISAADAGQTKPAKKAKPAAPVNPDEADQTDSPVVEEVIRVADPRTDAWASFVQALLGSAEFRYVQ